MGYPHAYYRPAHVVGMSLDAGEWREPGIRRQVLACARWISHSASSRLGTQHRKEMTW